MNGNIGPQHGGPVDLAGTLVELGEVHGAEGRDPRQDPCGAAKDQIGAPHIGPGARKGDAAIGHHSAGEARGKGFFAQRCLEAGRGNQEDVEGVVGGRAVHG
ncbi:hypothetical protein D3C87_1699090 [compost metagenome]